MDRESPYGLWLVEWLPMLYDIFTVVLLLGGCLLLWVTLRPGRRVIVTPLEPSDPGTSRHVDDYPAAGQFEPDTPFGAPVLEAFPSSERRGADAADVEPGVAVNQNSYASRVASALTKFRKQDPP
jgi:hypothetical protein